MERGRAGRRHGDFSECLLKEENDSVLSSPRPPVSAAGVDTDHTVGSGHLTDRIKYYSSLLLLG